MIYTEQKRLTLEKGWETISLGQLKAPPQVVLVFGARKLVGDGHVFQQIRNFYPGAYIILCSTAGEILDTHVSDESVALTAVHFEKSLVRFTETTIPKVGDSLGVGKRLAEFLPVEGLVHAMVFSEGLGVNGTQLVRGINDNLPVSVTVTGGLVGDGADFKQTLVGRDAPGESNKVVLLGFYGDALKVGFGSFGGWKPSGNKHTITRSLGNVLFELDHTPALSIYKKYLGEKARDLPGSALLFPLKLHTEHGGLDVVRTILSVNEVEGSMTFAGDMPEGVIAEVMTASIEDLVSGASTAANTAIKGIGRAEPELAILVSCVGRKLLLKDRIAEEARAVRAILGGKTALSGFYSYGELCPGSYEDRQCLLHNQTMTITAFREM